ncbi:hypothetical protein [Pseudomonas fluorescens]|uniref:Uncharacterized protein n=1 Tax=Pseudomonas fluorescens TaxID=294 RepID=A0A7Z6MZ92_PSEFL|nr:hypothetical protein [Pseudomonas fluorescens]RDS91737.1 hypothetical protein DL347_05760 [Pseudomonas fluorescens]
MSILKGLGLFNLPPLIRDHAMTHLGRLIIAADAQTLDREQVSADGFVEGLAAARAVTPASIEALYLAIEHIAADRLKELLQ